jgi:hypothetical protein
MSLRCPSLPDYAAKNGYGRGEERRRAGRGGEVFDAGETLRTCSGAAGREIRESRPAIYEQYDDQVAGVKKGCQGGAAATRQATCRVPGSSTMGRISRMAGRYFRDFKPASLSLGSLVRFE